MKLIDPNVGDHQHSRYIARQAHNLVVGDSVMKNGATLEIVNVVWSFQQGEQLIWSCFQVRNLDTNRQFLFTLRLNEWALLDTFKSRECGCQR